MADGLTIDPDVTALLAALDAFPEAMLARHLKPAARVTAVNVEREAKARVARRTGATAEGIHIEEAHDGSGYVVLPDFGPDVTFSWHTMKRSGRSHTQRVTRNNLPAWLEFGTRHMRERPFFFAAARLEEGAHDRRMRQAVVDAIADTGLGE